MKPNPKCADLPIFESPCRRQPCRESRAGCPLGRVGSGGKILENKFSDGQMSVTSTNPLRVPRLSRQQTRSDAGGVSCSLDGTCRGGMNFDLDRRAWRREITQRSAYSSSRICSSLSFFIPAQIEPIRSPIMAQRSGSLAVPPEIRRVLLDRLHAAGFAGCMQNRHTQRSTLGDRVPSLSTLTSKPADAQDNRRANLSQPRTQPGLKTATSDTNL